LCLCLLCGGSLLRGTAAAQERAGTLDPAGPSSVDASAYEQEFRQRQTEQLRWVALIFSGSLLLMGFLIYKRRLVLGYFSQDEMARLREQRQRLLRELALLDDQHARGALSEALYHAERQRRKQQLMEITQLCNRPL
jgi:hypothetical protein